MNNTRKGITQILSAAILTAAFMSSAVSAVGILPNIAPESDIRLTLGGAETTLANKPFADGGEVYIPIREFLGKASESTQVIWNIDRSIVLKRDGVPDVKIAIDSLLCEIGATDSKTYELKNAPRLCDEKTYVPYELLSLLNKEVSATNGMEISLPGGEDKLKQALVWADSLKTRDGKPRYEMMTEDMQQKFIENQKEYINGEDWNYIIGYSSPRIVSYDILIFEDSAYIIYYQADNTDEHYSTAEKISFTEKDGKLLVCAAEELGN